MLRRGAILAGFLWPCCAVAQGSTSLHATYATYAAGIEVAEVESGISFGPWTYQMQFDYHTTGLVGFFYRGHEADTVRGSWNGNVAVPTDFLGQGLWRGEQREVELSYQNGTPTVAHLIPPNAGEREPVPDVLRTNTIDTVSALAQLIHVVAQTGRCDTTVRIFDGRRAVEIEAHTVGQEVLRPTDRSSFSGPALRCDFEGRLLAGFKIGDDRARDSRPMHGSAWLAPVAPNSMALPVRLSFETRWFGTATMYLTDVGSGADIKVARQNRPTN